MLGRKTQELKRKLRGSEISSDTIAFQSRTNGIPIHDQRNSNPGLVGKQFKWTATGRK
ncbi:Hypothetical predicted protein, partial [Pelobates cultripes]